MRVLTEKNMKRSSPTPVARRPASILQTVVFGACIATGSMPVSLLMKQFNEDSGEADDALDDSVLIAFAGL